MNKGHGKLMLVWVSATIKVKVDMILYYYSEYLKIGWVMAGTVEASKDHFLVDKK